MPIQNFPLRNAVNSGITFSMEFQSWEAAAAAGLNLWEWEQGNYTSRFQAKVIAWFRLHNLVQAHTQDAAQKKK